MYLQLFALRSQLFGSDKNSKLRGYKYMIIKLPTQFSKT